MHRWELLFTIRSKTTVSVRGLLYSDGVYREVRGQGGMVLKLKKQVERLYNQRMH